MRENIEFTLSQYLSWNACDKEDSNLSMCYNRSITSLKYRNKI